MSTQIDFRTLPANIPVLCIPRVYPNINESRIRDIFNVLNMGILDRIDIVRKHSDKGEKFNRVFIHFGHWNNSENARIARERLLNGKEIKIIYDDPWFWKISVYRETEHKLSAPQNVGKRRATNYNDDRTSSARPVISYRDDRQRDELRRQRIGSRDERPYKPRDEPKHQDQEKTKIEQSKTESMKINYGDLHLMLPKHTLAKKNLKIEDEKEPGEI